MKGSECRLIEYMDGSKKRFIIPVYQRNYDWRIENCKLFYWDSVYAALRTMTKQGLRSFSAEKTKKRTKMLLTIFIPVNPILKPS